MGQMKGKASIEFELPPVIISAGSVVGKKEGNRRRYAQYSFLQCLKPLRKSSENRN